MVEFRSAPDLWMYVEWAPELDREFSVEIVIYVINQRGLLATTGAGYTDHNSNIEAIEIVERDEHSSTMRLTIGVHHRKHLADVIRTLRNFDTVSRVHRKRA